MSDEQITLFDIPSQGENYCWSPNAWKARLVLNYKNLPYTTQWVEYPDIAPLFQSYGIPANESGATHTVPAVQLPDGRYVMESRKIAEALETLQPEPSLHLSSPLTKRTQDAVTLVNEALGRIARGRVPGDILNPRSAEYFRRTRAERYGVPWEDVALKGDAIEVAWEKATEGMKDLKNILSEDDAGPFVLGTEPGFADFILAGFWRFMQILDQGGDLSGRLLEFDESFEKHLKACETWLQRDN